MRNRHPFVNIMTMSVRKKEIELPLRPNNYLQQVPWHELFQSSTLKKERVTSIRFKLGPRYGHVTLVSGNLALTGVNWAATRMSKIKEVRYKLLLECGRYLGWLCRRRRRRCRCREHAPTSNNTSHDNHDENKFMDIRYFPIWVWCSSWRPFGPMELGYELWHLPVGLMTCP